MERPIRFPVLHKYVTYLLKHLPAYLQPRDPHGATEFELSSLRFPNTHSKFTKQGGFWTQ